MYDFSSLPNSLEEFWMPFTPNRAFKKAPRIITKAEGMYIYEQDGREILDMSAGLYCVNAGHNAPRIQEAMKAQMEQLHYVPAFNLGHPAGFMAAKRLVDAFPEPFSHVFFTNSGSESVDTALKIARAYHRFRGDASRVVLVGRERSYHGVGYGGLSVSGTFYNRMPFGPYLGSTDFLPHTHDLEHNSFKKGQPDWGGHLAENLERIVYVHGAENIAAVIVEPCTGSTGILPPPVGYLQKLREICDKYGILLIFDEVVTGFGRMGSISSSTYFGVTPDIITTAKGLTNGAVPMGAVFVQKKIYDAFAKDNEAPIELMHGYTYSGHPLACAAALGTLDTYEELGVFANARKMMPIWEEAVHSLRGKPRVVDIRNCGMMAAVQLEEYSKDDPYYYPRTMFFENYKKGVYARFTALNMILTPPLILNENHIDRLITTIGETLDTF